MKNFYKVLVIYFVFMGIPAIKAETIKLNQSGEILLAQADVPEDWRKNLVTKENGVILNLKNGNAEMEIRNFVLPDADMDFIINAKAARMYAKYSYINILLEKKEEQDNIKKEVLFWEMRFQGKTFYEKTVIQKYQNNILILSCSAPASEYQYNRVIFENAVLSLRFNMTITPEIKPENIEEDNQTPADETENDETAPQTPQQKSDKTEIKKETVKKINEGHNKNKKENDTEVTGEEIKEPETDDNETNEKNQEIKNKTENVTDTKIQKTDKLKKNP